MAVMEIVAKECPPIGTNAYALVAPERGEMLVIDAPQDAFRWAESLAEERGCRITGVVLTHGHWDHMLDGHRFNEAGAPVRAHAADRPLFENPEVMRDFAAPGVELRAVAVDGWLEDGDRLDRLGRDLRVRHVPGHCPGNLLVEDAEAGIAFVGDVIFAGGVGRYDLPGADWGELERSIREVVYAMPDATALYPGHGPPTTVAAEKRGNPFVQG